jgi:hypothetical protein
MADRALRIAPGGLGTDWTAQLVPSHRSVNIASSPVASTLYPTAMHDVADAHVRPRKTPSGAPAALALGTIDHPPAMAGHAATPASANVRSAVASATRARLS